MKTVKTTEQSNKMQKERKLYIGSQKNQQIKDIVEIELPWKNKPKNMGNRLHGICSYMAMFPPTIPNYYIQKYSKEGDIVLDMFSGRGTTSLEACMLGRYGIGSDISPLAYVLTKAKVELPQRENIIKRIYALWTKYKNSAESVKYKGEKWQIRMLFNDYTLKQLVFLKKNLNWKKNSVDAFITALILGILHGNSVSYLSIPMPNTFSMSPNYVKKYIKEHNLEKPKRDVFELALHKLNRCYQHTKRTGKVYFSDARNLSRIKNNSVALSVTSPPYTRVIRYGSFNWIRLWFLNYDAKDIDIKLFCSQSLDNYQKFMEETLRENWRVLKKKGVAVYVIGDVKKKESDEIDNLAKFVWEECAQKIGFSLIEPIQIDAILDNTKVSKIWGAKRGMATKIDRILIMQK